MANMLDDITALDLAAKRTPFDLSDLDTWPYVIVGNGAYVEKLLVRINKRNLRLPEYILVQEEMTLSVDVKQCIDDGKSIISASHIVLGSGSFQLEMLHRLSSRCNENTVFIDVMECAPKTFRTLGNAEQYLIYVDLYSDINIPKYLTNFFVFLNSHGLRIEVFHPLESLSDEYVKNSQGLIAWNGALPAFVPMLSQAKRLSQNITFAECGFFPQHQYFYLDKTGVNNKSQLAGDRLNWLSHCDMDLLASQRSLLGAKDKQIENGSYVFVPLQVPSDSNVLNHSNFTNGMQAFIDYIESIYTQTPVVIKPHPKDRLADTYTTSHAIFSFEDTATLIQGAAKVHGINSSVLYEAAMAGVPILVEGECLLKQHMKQTDKLLAAMLYRQFDINDIYFEKSKIEQFSSLELQGY